MSDDTELVARSVKIEDRQQEALNGDREPNLEHINVSAWVRRHLDELIEQNGGYDE